MLVPIHCIRYALHVEIFGYCTISIDSSVTRHGGYLTCRNMGTVTVSRRVLTKGQKCDKPHCGNFGLNLGILFVNGFSGVLPLYVPS